MDDRCTIIDDEASEEAVLKMRQFQSERGQISPADPAARITPLEIETLRASKLVFCLIFIIKSSPLY